MFTQNGEGCTSAHIHKQIHNHTRTRICRQINKDGLGKMHSQKKRGTQRIRTLFSGVINVHPYIHLAFFGCRAPTAKFTRSECKMERHAEVFSEDISCKAKKQHWGGHKSKMRANDLMERARGETRKKWKFLKKNKIGEELGIYYMPVQKLSFCVLPLLSILFFHFKVRAVITCC